MKLLTKLSLIATTFAVIGTSAALADDQQLQNRLAVQRAQTSPSTPQTTVAAYANQRGAGRMNMSNQCSESRFELRSNAHGQTYGAYVPAK